MANFNITPQELEARFGTYEVAKWSELGVDVQLIIADACGEAYSYLLARYSQEQLLEIPFEVRGAVADLVRERAYIDADNETVKTRAENARKLLAAIGAGKASVQLFDNPETPEDDTATETAVFTANARVFGRSEMAGW